MAGKVGSILWAAILGIGLVVFIGSVMLPSTKRGRFDVRDLERMEAEERAAEAAAAAAVLATQPTTGPATASAATAPAIAPSPGTSPAGRP